MVRGTNSNKLALLSRLFDAFEKETYQTAEPMTAQIVHDYGRDPFLILISCLLSLRARDTMTYPVSKKLFRYAKTPQELLNIPLQELEKIIKSVGFYRRKAFVLKEVSQELIDRFGGIVPSTEKELLSIKGIGRKTANLVLGEAFGIPALCVDTHVHRIANHLELVHTATPFETEQELKKIVPRKWWIRLNYLFVKWGQSICTPYKKHCTCWKVLSKYSF